MQMEPLIIYILKTEMDSFYMILLEWMEHMMVMYQVLSE